MIPGMDRELKGVIADIIFENEETGFKICELDIDGDTVVIKGTLPFVQIGENVLLTGEWVTHEIYGAQFSVDYFEKKIPENPDDMEAFLASGLISGVGNATAHQIVKSFGDDTFQIISEHPEMLETVKGISHNKAMLIHSAFKEHFQMSDIVMFLSKFGASTRIAVKAYKAYGGNAVNIIKENPYRLADDVPEIGFKTVDKIGSAIGLPYDSDPRIYAGIMHCLKKATQYGHVYVPMQLLADECGELLGVENDKIYKAIDELDILSKVNIQLDESGGKIVYIPFMYYCENYTAERLIKIADYIFNFDEKNFENSIKQFADITGCMLDDNQISAVRTAGEHGLTIITGGPGTGKTTIIRALVHFMSSCGRKCVLAAPTGRAAKRMSEACGINAKTIHRLLEFSGDESSDDIQMSFKKNEDNQIEADVVVIDEVSMVDTLLMYHLLKALPDNVQLILVGDKDQLPSVGPGNVLKDIIASHIFPTVTLSVIYRQESGSLITLNAHKINNGEMPELNKKDGDFFIIGSRNPKDSAETVTELCTKRLPNAYGINPIKDIQVLIPSRKGASGSENMNRILQEKLNPPEMYKKEIALNSVIYREGDRIMQIKNNYKLEWHKKGRAEDTGEGVFNGEMGEITYINDKARELTVLFDDEREAVYQFAELSQLEHCYAITVHKSQGSEFPYCVISLTGISPMLMTRNILYTAITRAKKMVIIVGTKENVKYMTDNNRQQLRYTDLRRKIEEYAVR